MKYDVENLQKIKVAGTQISELIRGEFTDLVNRSINIKSELERADEVLLTPERTDIDIAYHADLVKQYGETFVKQLDAVWRIRKLVNQLSANLEIDYMHSVQVIKK